MMTDGSILVGNTGKKLNTKVVTTSEGEVHNEIVEQWHPNDRQRDAWGIQKVSLPHSTFHGMFTFDIPSSMWFVYEDGVEVANATATNVYSSGGAAHVLADATHPDVKLESRECPRYQPDRGILLPTALTVPTAGNDGEAEWGGQTNENGVFFRLKSDGQLYAVIKSGGVETHEELIDMQSVIPGWSATQKHTYDIQAMWRGHGDYTFYVDLMEVHKITFLGVEGSGVSIENPALPWCFKATRNTQDMKIVLGCADITSENGQTDKEQYGSSYAEDVNVNGTDAPVLTIYNPLQINSTTNTRTITLARISVKMSKKGTFKVWCTRDPSAFTGQNLVEIANGSTHVQTDSPDMVAGAARATAFDTSKAVIVRPIPVEAAKETQVDNPYRGRIEFPVVRGDYIVITSTGSAATAEAVFEWGEQI